MSPSRNNVERSGHIEHDYDHPRAALEHAIRDPAIAQHEGWRQDARAAVDEIERLRGQHAGAVEEGKRLRRENDALRMKLDYAVAKIGRYRDQLDRAYEGDQA